MTNKYKRFNLKRLFLSLMAGIIAISLSACMEEQTTFPNMDDPWDVIASQTGPLDPSGNTITNIVWVTNTMQVTNEVIWYVTNTVIIPGKEIYETIVVTNKVNGKDVWFTNYVYVDRITYKTEYVTNTMPDERYVSKWHKSFMYRVYAPFTGIGKEGEFKYTNVSYLDTDTLSELWKKMMRMESTSGKQFTIRNRQRKDNGAFFFFDRDAHLYWSKRPNEPLKRFQHGVIIQHRCGNDTKGAYAIAGVYRLTKSSAELRGWADDGVNIIQGYYFRQERRTHEYDIMVLNPGHVVNGKDYGFELYHSSWNYPAGISPYLEQRPEYVMSKVTHVFEAWKNWRPNELYDMPFQITSGNLFPR